jgi:glycosyltransferase involved in cell wall biosynthesis
VHPDIQPPRPTVELIRSLKPECELFGNRLQIVISDNGSTDETAAACRQRKFFSVKVASDFSEDGSLCGFGFFC